MSLRSASVHIDLDQGKVEMHGSEEFVSEHLRPVLRFVEAATGHGKGSNQREDTEKAVSDHPAVSPERASDEHRPEAAETHRAGDQAEPSPTEATATLPETPRGLFEQWRAHIHNDYIAKYLLTTALGACWEDRSDAEAFSAEDVRGLYREIGTTADIEGDLQTAREKHLIEPIEENGERRRFCLTALGRKEIRSSFAR